MTHKVSDFACQKRGGSLAGYNGRRSSSTVWVRILLPAEAPECQEGGGRTDIGDAAHTRGEKKDLKGFT